MEARRRTRRAKQGHVKCAEGHHITWMKTEAILRIYGVPAEPGEEVKLDVGVDGCNVCRRKAEKEAQREVRRIKHLYRPEQRTAVTLHNVYFAFSPKDQPDGKKQFFPTRTSFYAQVTEVDEDLSVTFRLIPSPDINFRFVRPIRDDLFRARVPEPTGSRLQRGEDGICFVKLTHSQLDQSLGLVVLGKRCKPDRCGEEGCGLHELRPIEVLAGAPRE